MEYLENLLTFLKVGFAVVFLFGASIFVHEWGHYWVARRRGLIVEEFAIGFGPKMFSWTKDGIVYSVRWIPAGGFVKLPQMITSEAIEGAGGEPKEKLPTASPLSRILVAVAGPVMNVIFAFAIAGAIYYLGLPVLVNPSVIGHVKPESPEYVAGIRGGDIVVGVNGKAVTTWQDVHMATLGALSNSIAVEIERKGERKTYTLMATNNPDLGWKMLDLDPADHPEVKEVIAGGAAEEAKLQVKDVVLAFGGVPMASVEQLIDAIRIRGGQATDMKVQRGNQEVVLKITPKVDPATKKGRIGASLGANSKQIYRVQKPGPKPTELVGDVINQMLMTFRLLAHSKETGVGAKDLSGPVGIAAMLATQVNTDYRLAMKFLVLLNINLAFLNLLPIPVLDGGHIVMALFEWVRRRPVSVKFQEYATTAFAVLLISFMLYVTFFDIKRMSFFTSMFKQDSQIESVEKAPATPAPAK